MSSRKSQSGRDQPRDADLLVKQDVRGGLLASTRAHRMAAYRSPPTTSSNPPATPQTDSSAGSSTDSRTPIVNPTIGPLVYHDDFDSFAHSFKGSPESPSIEEVRRNARREKRRHDFCITVLILATFLCMAGITTAVLYFSVFFTGDSEAIIPTNTSSLEDKNNNTAGNVQKVSLLKGSLLITESDAIQKNPVESDLALLVERGLRRSIKDSHLTSRLINTTYHSSSYEVDGIRTHFIVSVISDPNTSENEEDINVVSDLGMVIVRGIESGHFQPLEIDVNYFSLQDQDGRIIKRSTTTNRPKSTRSITPVSPKSTSSVPLTTNDGPLFTSDQDEGFEITTESLPSKSTTAELLTETTKDIPSNCGELGLMLSQDSPAGECARHTEPILNAFPSLVGQCHHLKEMVDCISKRMDCTDEQTLRSVLNAKKWFKMNFRSFDPDMCP